LLAVLIEDSIGRLGKQSFLLGRNAIISPPTIINAGHAKSLDGWPMKVNRGVMLAIPIIINIHDPGFLNPLLMPSSTPMMINIKGHEKSRLK